MPKLSSVRNIVSGRELDDKIKEGVEKIYNVALASYGVNSGNVMIEHRYGEPLVSHDGITNVGKLVVEDSVENMVVSLVRQASEKTNRDAGDATTLTVILSKVAYEFWLSKQQYLTPRQIQKQIDNVVAKVLDYIKENKHETTDELLRGVSRISAGDEAIGDMVFHSVKESGEYGGITVVETAEPTISTETVKGFTFKKGLKSVALANDLQALKSRYTEPTVIVMSKLITKNEDILPILDQTIISGATGIVLIADVSGQALESIIANRMNGKLDIAVVEPPAVDREIFLQDVAQYTSTVVFSEPVADFDVNKHCGSVDEAYITLSETTLNGCKTPDTLAEYVANISSEARLEMLNGKTVRISVGAPTQAERQELKLRIEDAVCAAKTALTYGVLPGGGVFLRDMYNTIFKNNDDFADLSYFTKPFSLLTGDNVGIVGEYNVGVGMDIYTGSIVDNMVDAGIVDSAKAIEEAVVNSHSIAAQLVSIKTALTFKENMD